MPEKGTTKGVYFVNALLGEDEGRGLKVGDACDYCVDEEEPSCKREGTRTPRVDL